MIAGISIKNFKAIRKLKMLPLDRFQVLTGPNGSGKSTFLDAFDFIRDCLENGPVRAVESRVPEYDDLTWMRQGGTAEFEMWLDIGHILESRKESIFNYRFAVCKDNKKGVCVRHELLRQYSKNRISAGRPFEFSNNLISRRILEKTAEGRDFYQGEIGSHQDYFVFGPDKLALSLTPPDEERYPSANAVRRLLVQGIRYLRINSRLMRLPCSATRPAELEPDGSNLARVVARLLGNNENSGKSEPLERWTEHLRYALPGLKEVRWDKRQPDNAEFLVLRYESGLECPGWLLSDGSLRMLALTLPAFLPPSSGIYMVEEPENGVHPNALEIILRSLSAIPQAQTMLATHSPFVVQHVGPKPLLCFSYKNDQTEIITGPEHPVLKTWDGTPDLATIFASGVMG